MNDPSMGNQPTVGVTAPPPATATRSINDRETLRAEAQRKRYRSGDRLLGRYRIIGELGQGGMGVVFRCFDETGGIEVAIKALPPELSHDTSEMEEVRENFRLVQGLAHPNIAQIKTLERDADSGDYFLVMERVEGVNLRQWRKQKPEVGGQMSEAGRVPPSTFHPAIFHRPLSDILPILRQIAVALDFAHSRKIVHRDIKPANIMVAPDGAAKVLDFGLAAQIHSSMTRVSQVHYGTSGTGPYMAPEQWKGWRQDAATDQYALAVLAYELFTGAPPFDASDAAVLKELVYKEQPRRPEGLDDGAWKALARGLAKEPKDRYENCADLVSALSGDPLVGRGRRTRREEEHAETRTGRRYWVLGIGCLVAASLATWWFAAPPNTPPSAPPREIPNTLSSVPPPGTNIRPPPPNTETLIPNTNIPFRFEIEPPNAQLTLTHDTRGLVAEKTVPANGLELPLDPGSYRALVSMAGYRSVEQEIEVSATETRWRVKLAERRGELTIRTDPDVAVSIRGADGTTRPFGATPATGILTLTTLREGDYTVLITKNHYCAAEVPAKLIEGKVVEIKQSLEPLPGKLKVAGRAGLTLWEQGNKLGATDNWLDLSAGVHTLELRCAGFRTERLDITMPPEGTLTRAAPAMVAESGTIRVAADAPAAAQEFLAKTAKRAKIGDGEWQVVKALPHTADGLACSPTDILLEAEGFTVDAASRRVTPRDGQTAEARITLTPKPAQLILECAAPGAEVFDATGARICAAGAPLALAAFTPYTLTVRAPRHVPATATIAAMEPEARAKKVVALEEQKYPTSDAPWENSLGMKFVPVKGTEVLFCTWLTRVQDFEAFVKASGHDATAGMYSLKADGWKQFGDTWKSPGFTQGPTYPVCGVSWEDAQAFCRWLTKEDRRKGLIGPDQEYRLPKDWEWSVAVCLNESRGGTPQEKNGKIADVYPWGTTWPPPAGAGNYAGEEAKTSDWPSNYGVIGGYRDGYARTAPAGSFKANKFGLYDMGGNVWQWCEDFDDGQSGSRVLRGGSWYGFIPRFLLSSFRGFHVPGFRGGGYGFRCVLVPAGSTR